MKLFDQMATEIVKEQELVIGPLAWTEAAKVQGLEADPAQHEAFIANGDQKEVINRLVSQYERLFGKASQEVCRGAVVGVLANLAASDIPSSLAK